MNTVDGVSELLCYDLDIAFYAICGEARIGSNFLFKNDLLCVRSGRSPAGLGFYVIMMSVESRSHGGTVLACQIFEIEFSFCGGLTNKTPNVI